MKRIALFALWVLFLSVPPALAEIEISILEVKPVTVNRFIVQYSWTVDVSLIKAESNFCMLRLSFFDASGSQVHSKSRHVTLSEGMNHLKGYGICKPEIWEKIKRYKVHITCP